LGEKNWRKGEGRKERGESKFGNPAVMAGFFVFKNLNS